MGGKSWTAEDSLDAMVMRSGNTEEETYDELRLNNRGMWREAKEEIKSFLVSREIPRLELRFNFETSRRD